jgi:hypothetical protein
MPLGLLFLSTTKLLKSSTLYYSEYLHYLQTVGHDMYQFAGSRVSQLTKLSRLAYCRGVSVCSPSVMFRLSNPEWLHLLIPDCRPYFPGRHPPMLDFP